MGRFGFALRLFHRQPDRFAGRLATTAVCWLDAGRPAARTHWTAAASAQDNAAEPLLLVLGQSLDGRGLLAARAHVLRRPTRSCPLRNDGRLGPCLDIAGDADRVGQVGSLQLLAESRRLPVVGIGQHGLRPCQSPDQGLIEERYRQTPPLLKADLVRHAHALQVGRIAGTTLGQIQKEPRELPRQSVRSRLVTTW